MRGAAVLAALALSSCLAGCATLFAGGPDEFTVTTQPSGAIVYLDGKDIGRTPMVMALDRKRSLGNIQIYHPGFRTVALHRYLSFNWWAAANFFIGMIPIVVDIATGDYMRFDGSDITLRLMPGDDGGPFGHRPQQHAPPPPMPQPPAPSPQEPRPPGPAY